MLGVSTTPGLADGSGGPFAQIGRQGDAGGLKDAADLAGDGSAGGDALAVFLDGGLLQAVEIAQQVGPFDDEAVALAQIGQLLLRAAMVAAEIMPRSATTHTRPIWKRSRNRSTTGSSTVASAVLPGSISVQIGRP